MTIAWVIADSFVRKRSAFESESEISNAFFTNRQSTGWTAGEGIRTSYSNNSVSMIPEPLSEN
jgi:hypothetical protein